MTRRTILIVEDEYFIADPVGKGGGLRCRGPVQAR